MEIQNVELHRITSTAIIRKDGKYLIVKRSPDKKVFPGRWTVPGGGLETTDYIDTPKTTPEAWYYAIENSLKREIEEEVGLKVGKLNYLLDLVFIRPDNIPVATLSYWCEWESGEVKLNEENVDFKWVTVEEAKNYDLISGIAEEIEMVDKILKGEKNPNEVKFGK
jgi:8-oxo-dGTP pyrophosphatase MutT (NUDIX family)